MFEIIKSTIAVKATTKLAVALNIKIVKVLLFMLFRPTGTRQLDQNNLVQTYLSS